MPANRNLAGAEIELVALAQRESRLKITLEKIRSDYDFIFIDTPPSLGLLTVNALRGGGRRSDPALRVLRARRHRGPGRDAAARAQR